ncbi:MAG: class II fructose-bisphosphate aldolase [Bacilli bacterium]|nr:class II fructose-bisphosphate aldolase [Bacilli bacterium]
MALVTLRSVLKDAERGNYAVGSFNFFGLENVQGIVWGAARKQSPVIAQVSPGCVKHIGEHCICGMVEGISNDYGIPVVLHLDHAMDYDAIRRCIDYGFTSVMIDASSESFEENVERTCRVVEYAMKYGVSVEAELGHVGGQEDGVEERESLFTNPEMAKKFCEICEIDALAVAVGTVHGFYKLPPKIEHDRIAQIHTLVPHVPLVLHGGTGVPDDDFRKAIQHGIRKINIGTELWYNGYGNTMKKHAELMPINGDPRKVMAQVREACAKIVEQKIEVFGSEGKLTDQ